MTPYDTSSRAVSAVAINASHADPVIYTLFAWLSIPYTELHLVTGHALTAAVLWSS
jgi:hypothetical protein